MDFWIAILPSIHGSLFYQIATLLILTAIIGFVFLQLKQPLVVAYIAVGLLAGPEFLNVLNDDSKTIDSLAALGIALLLFLVGLKLDFGLIKKLGVVAAIAGISQVTLTALAGYLIAFFMGFNHIDACLIAVSLSFSSTIIVVKLLSDKREIESLYGKICIGILIIQDIAVIMSMVVLTAISTNETGTLDFNDIAEVFGKLVMLIIATVIFIKFIANPLTERLSKSLEMLAIFAIGFAAVMASICHALDLSKEMGGLLAGMALASTPYRNVIATRLTNLRDFLLLFFFITLGSQLDTSNIGDHLFIAIIISAFVMFGKPLIIMVIMGLMGYRKRTGFMTGVTLAQISEFSLIFCAMAFTIGLVSNDIVVIITLVGIITITVSTYGITFAAPFYNKIEDMLSIFEKEQPKFEEENPDSKLKDSYDVIIFGMGRYGTSMAREFRSRKISVLGVDFDPEAIIQARKNRIPAVYGDASDAEFPATLPIASVNSIILATPHVTQNLLAADTRLVLARTLREMGFKGNISVVSYFREEEKILKENGIDIVLCPFEDAAEKAAEEVMSEMNIK